MKLTRNNLRKFIIDEMSQLRQLNEQEAAEMKGDPFPGAPVVGQSTGDLRFNDAVAAATSGDMPEEVEPGGLMVKSYGDLMAFVKKWIMTSNETYAGDQASAFNDELRVVLLGAQTSNPSNQPIDDLMNIPWRRETALTILTSQWIDPIYNMASDESLSTKKKWQWLKDNIMYSGLWTKSVGPTLDGVYVWNGDPSEEMYNDYKALKSNV